MSQGSSFSTNTLSDMFLWWYLDFSKTIFSIIRYYFIKLWDTFSVSLLLKSLFAPWKQDEYSTKNVPGALIFRIWIMNLVSRFIGLLIRGCVIFVALASAAILAVISGLAIVAYYLAPVILIGMIISGILSFFVR